MIENSSISVIMSVYKNDNLIHFMEAVDSLLSQTFPASEIIIVADGPVPDSIDKYLDELSKDSLFIIKKLDTNKGLANALNLGIAISTNEYIARMDADDICFPNRFELQLKRMLDDKLDFVGGQCIEFGKTPDDIISHRILPTSHNEIVKFLSYRSPFTHPSVIFRKSFIKSINGYNSRIFPEDYDLFVRAYLQKARFGNINETILWFRIGEDMSAAIKRRWGYKYAKSEFNLYRNFYRLGFYNFSKFVKVSFLKLPLRILPFPIFKFVYFNFFRK